MEKGDQRRMRQCSTDVKRLRKIETYYGENIEGTGSRLHLKYMRVRNKYVVKKANMTLNCSIDLPGANYQFKKYCL